jgi:5-formyltetrahydrofolate cyclo-ligase
VALPAIPGKDTALEFRAWQPEDVLGAGPLGTASPAPNRPVLRPEIVLVPMLAFDRGRHRLGYGGGYYDRTLAALRADGMPVTAIGVAYAGLELAAVPTDPWDERVDAILTEGGLIECRT